MEERKLREIQVGTEDIFEGVILNVKRDQVQLPNASRVSRTAGTTRTSTAV